jgi:hypothetical protein
VKAELRVILIDDATNVGPMVVSGETCKKRTPLASPHGTGVVPVTKLGRENQ